MNTKNKMKTTDLFLPATEFIHRDSTYAAFIDV